MVLAHVTAPREGVESSIDGLEIRNHFGSQDGLRGVDEIRAQSTLPRLCSAISRRDHFKIAFQGSCDDSMWGMAHFPVISHAAHKAINDGEKCVVVEAGARKGALAILAAKLGCKVYAFEADPKHVADMKSNLKLNHVSEDAVHVFQTNLGDQTGSRVDEFVPKGKVTVLKMDIDGMDAVAMSGSRGLFDHGGVEVINIEFSPPREKDKEEKDKKEKNVRGFSSLEYLRRLTDMGYTAYLAGCYGNSAKTSPPLEALGMRCTLPSRDDGSAFFTLQRTGKWSETTAQETFLNCLLGESKCAERAELERNRVKPSAFKAFFKATKDLKLDLVLTKNTH